MKTLVRGAVAPLVFAAACQAAIVLGAEAWWTPGNGQAALAGENEKIAARESLPPAFEELRYAAPFPPDGEIEPGWWVPARSYWTWTLDYRVRSFVESHTSYEFGLPEDVIPTWAPLSKLDWSLDSTWHGFQAGIESPTERIHFEWLTPLEEKIHGSMSDFDWTTPEDPSRLDSLTHSSQRWREGQMIDLGAEMKLTERFFNWPVEIWPMLGFRWQRFSITAYDVDYIVPPLGPVYEGDVITFSQQYYMVYIGGQLHANVNLAAVPVLLTFQGDWGRTWGYNADHHLLRAGGDRYTMERTHGGTTHLAMAAEAFLNEHLSLGFQVDHLRIRTSGTHRMLWNSQGFDATWSNGVFVKSDQTSLTAFLRARF